MQKVSNKLFKNNFVFYGFGSSANIVPDCRDIAKCKGCTDDVECFCASTKQTVRFPCTLGENGIKSLETYDVSS